MIVARIAAGDFDISAVLGNDPLRDPQPKPGALFAFGGVKGAEQLGQILFRNARPVVLYGQGHGWPAILQLRFFNNDFDLSAGARRRRLHFP